MDTQDNWYSEETSTFGDRLAAAREAAGMTQKDLAKRVGVKHGTLRNWEDDLAEPRANRLNMLSGILAVSLSWLLSGEGDGIDPPQDAADIPEDIGSILAEMRELRTEARRVSDRMGVLEKRLRVAVVQAQ